MIFPKVMCLLLKDSKFFYPSPRLFVFLEQSLQNLFYDEETQWPEYCNRIEQLRLCWFLWPSLAWPRVCASHAKYQLFALSLVTQHKEIPQTASAELKLTCRSKTTEAKLKHRFTTQGAVTIHAELQTPHSWASPDVPFTTDDNESIS